MLEFVEFCFFFWKKRKTYKGKIIKDNIPLNKYSYLFSKGKLGEKE
jgi:hypothetical protein